MTQPTLVAVVVTYNRLAQLKVTLDRLLSSAPQHLSAVVVFDNASDDGTGAFLAECLARQDAGDEDGRLHVITSPANLGGAGGFEAAMRAAHERFDPDWMVLMDDDARPVRGALETFHAVPRTPQEAWAAAVYYPDGRACDMNRPWINPFRSGADLLHSLRHGRDGFHLNEEDYQSDQTRDIDGGSFVGLFVARAAIERVGYPDGRLFLYGDDVLYTLGLSQAGGRIGFDPNIAFEHDCATLSGGPSPVMFPLWKVYYFHRNQVLVYRRAAGPVLFWPVLALKALSWWRRAAAYGPQRRAYLRLIRAALRDGLLRDTSRPRERVLEMAQD
ncbi:glycosyltransferase [Tropicibacter naphthalenivorans]|uniref:Glycosyl transferase family 2 n=1 Tax=Tropicibacter naphthalenivorans TaxID=441103 RepID=A0A0P1GKU8_9RHOB|nr:glycosyltransferase [Tropicibacter naphthalenivorans]CUH82616.1 Glycosyl transferase family 2 [Tropicibacter naphthalenivorans]SMD08877.1 Glycosyltransferase, GT2 family [Tropicibacter naphthalenivorans]